MIGRFRCLALFTALACHPAIAATPAEINQQIALNRSINDIALSPDGRTILAVITDSTEAGARAHLWLLRKGETPRQVTGVSNQPASEEINPQWSADGNSFFYLQKADGSALVRRMDVASGRSESLVFSSAGNVVTSEWTTTSSESALAVKGFAVAKSGVLAVWAAHSPAGTPAEPKDDHHIYGRSEPVHLYWVADQRTQELDLPDNVRTVTWNKEGDALLAITEPASDDLGELNHVWKVDRNRPPQELAGTAENVQAITWLSDDSVVYVARCSQDAPIVCRDLFVQKLDGSKPRNLTSGIDGSLINGIDGSSKTGPTITKSGEALVTLARGFDQQLARIRLSDARMTIVGSTPPVVKAVATNPDQTAFGLLAAERGGVVTVQLADGKLRDPAPVPVPTLQTPEWQPLHARRLEWVSDNHTIDGLLYLPDGTRPERQVPLVVDVHGGPAGRFEDIDYPLVRLLLAKGWAVLHVNPRGSFGYGTDFLASLKNDLGGGDYRDIMSGIDVAIAQAPIDRERLAMIGFSYGGTVVSFALGRTTRFKGLVAAAPVVDQISEYGTESSSWYDRWYFEQPWKRLEDAWRQSPLAGVAHARTPLLLLHGDADPVNPVGQSFEFYRALRQEGAPVELVLFPRETHHELGQNYFGFPSIEPAHGIALRQRIIDFLGDAFSGKPNAGLPAN